MIEIIDKLFIFILCSILYMQGFEIGNAPVPMLIVIILSCICTYFERRYINLISVILFAIICIFFPEFLIYMPVILYDLFYTEDWKYSMFYFIPSIMYISYYDVHHLLFVILILFLSYFSKYKTLRIQKLLQEYYSYRDNAKELEIRLDEKNQQLLINQNYEIHMATLNERNRISKEIHDNIGHLISRSLIHIGALLTMSKEKSINEGLQLLQNSLSEGMDSIRSSIHNIHNESIDLYTAIDTIVKDFNFCSINFDYNLKNSPPLHLKYFLIWTVKEALSNIMRHSNGSNVSIVLTEHPIMYQLIVYDNGFLSKSEIKKVKEMNCDISNSAGMGLRNMVERVQGLDGIIQFSGENGFRIFITIPIAKI